MPTLVNIATFPTLARRRRVQVPRLVGATCGGCTSGATTPCGAAYDAGVPVFVGTDAGGSLPHGLVGGGGGRAGTKAGIPPVEALSATTWGAREWLGRPALEEGARADLVVLRSDPRDDVGTVKDPSGVVLRGRVVL